MSTPEGLVKQSVRRTLTRMQENGTALWWHEPVTGGYGRSGIPDFEGCIEGFFFSIETKANGGTQTALQIRESMKITAAKGCYLLVDEYNVTVVDEMLEEWVQVARNALKATQTGVSKHGKSQEGRSSVTDQVRARPSTGAGRAEQPRHRSQGRSQQRIRVGGEVEDAQER